MSLVFDAVLRGGKFSQRFHNVDLAHHLSKYVLAVLGDLGEELSLGGAAHLLLLHRLCSSNSSLVKGLHRVELLSRQVLTEADLVAAAALT